MPPEKAEVLREWLKKASLDLGVCEYLMAAQPRFYEAAAFHAQQAVEKSLKAFLIYHDVRFRKIHELRVSGSSF